MDAGQLRSRIGFLLPVLTFGVAQATLNAVPRPLGEQVAVSLGAIAAGFVAGILISPPEGSVRPAPRWWWRAFLATTVLLCGPGVALVVHGDRLTAALALIAAVLLVTWMLVVRGSE